MYKQHKQQLKETTLMPELVFCSLPQRENGRMKAEQKQHVPQMKRMCYVSKERHT